jgi:hypothetical protein
MPEIVDGVAGAADTKLARYNAARVEAVLKSILLVLNSKMIRHKICKLKPFYTILTHSDAS